MTELVRVKNLAVYNTIIIKKFHFFVQIRSLISWQQCHAVTVINANWTSLQPITFWSKN